MFVISVQQHVLTDWFVQLPHAEEECSKCGQRDAVFFQSQQRTAETGMVCDYPSNMLTSADSSQALFYVCCNCQHVWSTLDAKK